MPRPTHAISIRQAQVELSLREGTGPIAHAIRGEKAYGAPVTGRVTTDAELAEGG